MIKFSRALIAPILLVCVLGLPGCLGSSTSTGGSGSSGFLQPGMDAEVIQGRNEKAFFATRSAKTGSILLVNSENHSARLLKIQDGKLAGTKSLNIAELLSTSDGGALTAKGEEGIFESSGVLSESVALGQVPFPDPTLDALCFPAPFGAAQSRIGESSYTDFRIKTERFNHQFLGTKNGEVEEIGGTGSTQRKVYLSEIIYSKSGFGKAHIYWNIPHTSNGNLFYTAFSFPSGGSELAQTANLFCQINPAVRGVDELVAQSFKNGGTYSVTQYGYKTQSLSQGSALERPWAFGLNGPIYNIAMDGPFVALTHSNQQSEALMISDFRFAVPETARITKILATLRRRANCYVPLTVPNPGNLETKVQLYNVSSKQALSPDMGRGLRVFDGNYSSASYEMASSPSKGPGVLSPKIVNNPNFAFTVSYLNDGPCVEVSLGSVTRMSSVTLTIDYVDAQ